MKHDQEEPKKKNVLSNANNVTAFKYQCNNNNNNKAHIGTPK